MTSTLPPAEPLRLDSLVAPTDHDIASRVLAKASGGTVTIFAFDAGEELSEHTTPFDALVIVLEGTLRLVIGGAAVEAASGTVVRLPANVPHAVQAPMRARMLLVMVRDQPQSQP